MDATTTMLPEPGAHESHPFHAGECAVQERAGVRQKLAAIGRNAIRDFMPEQHRLFFRQLPFVMVGSVDQQGQPWASVLADRPGFIAAPDPRRLVVRASPLRDDPLAETLVAGASIGLLGIEPHNRRRIRANGVVDTVTLDGFSVHVQQSFGNCPKYIQARRPEDTATRARTAQTVHRSDRLDAPARDMVLRADTLFVATAYPVSGGDGDPAHGVDVSHRGGKAGFVRIDGERTLVMPDFTGNFFFNTLGNIALNPRAGLLFIDFDRGDLLYLAVDAAIEWDGPEIDAFEGAQRLLRLSVREMRRVETSLPLLWGDATLSPFLAGTGKWG